MSLTCSLLIHEYAYMLNFIHFICKKPAGVWGFYQPCLIWLSFMWPVVFLSGPQATAVDDTNKQVDEGIIVVNASCRHHAANSCVSIV